MTSLRLTLLLLFAFLTPPLLADERFPQPPELQADVDFWVDVFTRYGTDEGVLHDNRYLDVVYETLSIPENLSRRERQRRVDQHRKKIQSTLRTLATGKRSNLTAEETRILALWPATVSDEELSAAANRIRYQHGLRQRMQRSLERAGRWRAYINDEFQKLGVPIEIAALPHVESSYNPEARSHVGASGIWQFTRSTGRRFMRVDHVVDERNDPFAATRGAGKLLAYNYSLTGNWPMAITAYNHGLGGVRRAMKQFGDNNYVEILRNYKGRTFGFASRNFYVAFLAAMEVDQNVERYFPGLIPEQPINYSEAGLERYVSADALSDAIGVSQRMLARYNPALQSTVWQGSKHLPKGFRLRIPSSEISGALTNIVAALPDDAVFSTQLPDLFHTIARGDTLSQIAATYDTRVSTLVALNNLSSSHRIRAGQRLRLPAAGPAPVVAASRPAPSPDPEPIETVEPVVTVTEMLPGAMVNDAITVPVVTTQTALLSDPSDYSVADDGTIEVHELETLGHFGGWLEIKTQRLRDLNGLAFRTPVTVGQRIRLDLNTVDVKRFEERRIAWHRQQQDRYFRQHVISGVTEHTVRAGDSIWVLAQRDYGVPFWLVRQYNPSVDLHRIRPGTRLQLPVLTDASES